MTTRSVEERLRDAADAAARRGVGVGVGEVPAEVLAAVHSRRRSRSVVATVAVAAAAAAVAAVAVVPALVTSQQPSHRHAPAGTSGPKSKQHVPEPTATAASFAPLPAPVVSPSQPEPATFLALIGAGSERLAVVDTQTGAVTKWLQQKGSQELATFSADLSTAYQPNPRGCDATWTQIDTATGASRPAFGELGRPLEVALSADGTRVAYVHQQGGSPRLGCGAGTESLVVSDATTGARKSWVIGPAGADSLYPAFDPTATRVAFVRDRRVWILDINHDAKLADARPLSARAPHAGCWQNKPVWRPQTESVLVTEQCPSGAAIVGYDVSTGKESYRHTMPGTDPIIAAFAVDASGKHVIYALSGVGQPGGSVYAVEGNDRHIVDGAYQVAW